jgi:hypothetical protein
MYVRGRLVVTLVVNFVSVNSYCTVRLVERESLDSRWGNCHGRGLDGWNGEKDGKGVLLYLLS